MKSAAPPAPAKLPLPGAAVTASNTLTGKKYSVVTDADGKFSFTGLVRGRYVLRIEFMGFSLFTRELVLNPANPSGKLDAELILVSRDQQQSGNSNTPASRPAAAFKATPTIARARLSPEAMAASAATARFRRKSKTPVTFPRCR